MILAGSVLKLPSQSEPPYAKSLKTRHNTAAVSRYLKILEWLAVLPVLSYPISGLISLFYRERTGNFAVFGDVTLFASAFPCVFSVRYEQFPYLQ
ncbi:hypothetical protein SuNHUV7_20190 (plasmid) [Pseudoseohaeicola sp. NH-UV-7]